MRYEFIILLTLILVVQVSLSFYIVVAYAIFADTAVAGFFSVSVVLYHCYSIAANGVFVVVGGGVAADVVIAAVESIVFDEA